MNEYFITHNYMEILTGTTNILNPVYEAVSEDVEKNTSEGYKYMSNFIKAIDKLSKKGALNDKRISESKGNVKNFKEYSNIKFAIDFLMKNTSGINPLVNCKLLLEKIEEFASIYTSGYDKHSKLVIFEYESAVYIITTALTLLMTTKMDVKWDGIKLKVTRKDLKTNGVIFKTLDDYTKQLHKKGHKEYLEALLKAEDDAGPASYHESVIMESDAGAILTAVSALIGGAKTIGRFGINAVKGIKNTLFGILPVIRSCMYLHYKKKADTIISLDQQVQFLKMNIEQLKNIKNMDEKKKAAIIKKQEATIEAYQKKAEKLRAQLVETEKEVATAIQKENPQMKNNKVDDEFVLESSLTVEEMFPEESSYGDTENF